MIKVSDQAKAKAIQLMTEDGFKPFEDYIRVGVKSGGCSGLEYVLKFDNEKQIPTRFLKTMISKLL
jgi:iron-sulfur cluster assembly protein